MSTSMIADLADLRVWLAWQGEIKKPGALPDKVPWRARGRLGHGSSTDAECWGTRVEATARSGMLPKPCGIGGVGVVLTEIGDGFALVGIDLDTCRDPKSGNIAEWAREVVERVASYTEVSPSERGLKIFFRMTIMDRDAILKIIREEPDDDTDTDDDEIRDGTAGIKWTRGGGEHPPAIELYLGKRFFTVTDWRLEDAPDELRVVGAETVRWLIGSAGPALAAQWAAANGHDVAADRRRDNSRSAVAFRIAREVHSAGGAFEEFCAAVRADPETVEWCREKGEKRGGRELKRAWERATPPPGPPWEISLSAPYDTARLFLCAKFTVDGSPTLHRHRGGFYSWNGAAYPEVAEAEIRAQTYAFLDECVVRIKVDGEWVKVPVCPNSRMVNELLDALRAAALLPDGVAAPAWLEDAGDDADAGDIIACANGLLHLPTLTLLPHTPVFFSHNALDFQFYRNAAAPEGWLAFLKQLWKEDSESIETLQEIFGYALVADTSQQKAFLIVGPKRSGKGTIARVLARLIGAENAVAPTLAGLGTNFGLAPLIGKRVAIVSDARLGGRADQTAIAERLLSITGEDAITVDRKYRDAWTGRLQARFIVLTNELPRLNDASGALASRFIVLVLTVSFYGREDPGLTNTLLAELPSILNWAIEGWRRLRERGHFVQPASALEAIEALEDLGSPIGAFLREYCVVGAGNSESIDELFFQWESWCMEQRREHSGNRQSFGRDLRAAVPGLKTIFPREGNTRVRRYEGIRLKSVEEKAEMKMAPERMPEPMDEVARRDRPAGGNVLTPPLAVPTSRKPPAIL